MSKDTHINFLIIAPLKPRLHFRSNIIGCAKTACEALLEISCRRRADGSRELSAGCQTEIADAWIICNVNEDIIRFQISMYNSMAMYVAQSVQDLPK